MFRKIFLTIISTAFLMFNAYSVYWAETAASTSYTTLWVVDIWTFNEYKYKITEQYIELRNKFEVTWKIDPTVSWRILNLAEQSYKYLPDDLINKNYYNYLKTAIERGQLYPENSSYFQDIAAKIEDYLEKTSIQAVKGNIEAIPSSGNAPLTVTLRWNVVDPTWTKLENHNYTWWMNVWWRRVVIWNKVALTYVFREEWNFTVFLDVTSNHKNSSWNVDVLPFSSRAEIEVKEKVASLVLKINSINLGNQDELKFLPDEARYWLLFDATSSTPTSWTQFIRTEWDFWNGVKRTYDWPPQVERVVYASEWDYTVKLTLRTNAWKSVERRFTIRVHQPIATINASAEEWYMWDKFTFSTTTNTNQTNLTFAWRIIDINNDTEVVAKNSSTFTYTFTKKGRYNVQLFVTEPSWDVDYDSKIIYINSRPPEAKLLYSIPNQNKPNTVFLDWSSSYDPDFSDDWLLEFSWQIDGQNVNLSNPNYNGSNWYYTFASLWDHSVTLTVTDPDNMTAIKTEKINVRSLLSVDFNAFPRVSQVDKTIRFIADSPKAQYYEWDFWDSNKQWETSDTTTHIFKRSWIYSVKLRVVDENDNENTFTKNVFIWDADYPFPFITLKDNKHNEINYESNQCNWEWAYLVNRVDTYTFSASESLDVTWNNTWLAYSWRMWNSLYSSQSFQRRFDDLWCSKVKLTVTSDKNWRSSTQEVNIKVVNLKPTLGSLDLNIKDINTDPVIVNVTAQWAKDEDWIIQSYLWYYYTDLSPEPQDFRSTRTNQTTFVLPKITWNYYFAVVMKDNNEARVNSEEINDSRYFVTLTWDNVNTPLLDLKVNNSSVAIWDEVIFTANVENILWQSLNNTASFSWDFDWDWFYDLETNTNVATHKYKQSWEMHAKVRVKHKWYSNSKTVTVNVANILKAEFDYVSVWNTFIFFDNSLSNWANYEWDMWDGNKVTSQWSFSYTYTDWKAAHFVKLTLTEWTKINEKERKVVKNMPNFMTSNKEPIAVYSNFPIENDTITLEDTTKEVYMYITSNKDNIAYYVADFNINYDSDMNWGNDDDEDNKFQDSYTTWEPILIELDNSKQQIVRLYIKDNDNKVLASKDIKIIKVYIEEDIDVDSIVFEWVSASTKLKLEKIKQSVSNFPPEHKMTWMSYVQRLQEEWNDEREKTNIIIEFEAFISEAQIPWWAELIDLLESLLVEWEVDKSEKSIAYVALKNLIPRSIQCVWKSLEELEWLENPMTCYDLLIAKLDIINQNSNVDENKVLWLQILENIAEDPSMTVKEKMDFKAILNTFVYGSLSNIPEENVKDVIDSEVSEWWWSSKVVSFILALIKMLWFGLLIIAVIIWLFFLYYKISNKDPSIWFTDFIAIKTWWSKKTETESSTSLGLEDLLSEEELKTPFENEQEKEVNINNEQEINTVSQESEEVPEWLKWSFAEQITSWNEFQEETQNEENQTFDSEEIQNEEAIKEEEIPEQNISSTESWNVPEWLKWSFSEDFNWDEDNQKQEQEEVKQEEIIPDNNEEDLNNTTESKQEWEVPEWLKWTLPEEESSDETENVPEIDSNEKVEINEQEPKLQTKEELDEFTKLEVEDDNAENSNIPDWLKWSFSQEEENEQEESETEQVDQQESPQKEAEEKKEEMQEVKEETLEKEEDNKKEIKTKQPRKTKAKKVENKENKNKQEKAEDTVSDNNEEVIPWAIPELDLPPDAELWDDWMKIPDWLKTDEEKNEN